MGSFSYTSHADFVFMSGVSLTHPVLPSFLWGEFLLYIPCCLDIYGMSFSYTSRAGFVVFIWGVSLTHPVLVYFYYWGVSLTYPVLASFLSEEFLLCIPCWPHFCLGSISYTSRAGFIFIRGSFSYTSRAGFTFIWVVSLTHAMLALFFCGEFLLHIPCWLLLF